MAIADCILQSYEMNFFVHNFFFLEEKPLWVELAGELPRQPRANDGAGRPGRVECGG